MGKYVSEETRQAILNERNRAWRPTIMEKVFWDIYDGYKAGTIDSKIYYEAVKHRDSKGRFADDFLAMLIAEDNEIEMNQRQKVIDNIWHEFSGDNESMPELPNPNIVIIHDKQFPDIIRDICIVYPHTIPPISFVKTGIFNAFKRFINNDRSLNLNLNGKVYEVESDSHVDLDNLDFKALDKQQENINLNYMHHIIDEKPFLTVQYKDDTK